MHFDYTYITLFGFIFFEPMVVLTNLLFFILTLYCFFKLNKIKTPYAKQMALFILFLGISSCFGSLGHTLHYQFGVNFFKVILFLMNAFSLFSVYFCFRAPYTYYTFGREPSKTYPYLVMSWVAIVLVFSAMVQDFTIIKIHAALVLLYALLVHYILYRRYQHFGSREVVLGILLSFIPIIVHTLKLSFSKWFNHKDLSHVIMIFSLAIIYRGVKINSEDMESGKILPAA